VRPGKFAGITGHGFEVAVHDIIGKPFEALGRHARIGFYVRQVRHGAGEIACRPGERLQIGGGEILAAAGEASRHSQHVVENAIGAAAAI
jgi:hypothetical protein